MKEILDALGRLGVVPVARILVDVNPHQDCQGQSCQSSLQ